ncbi:DNA methyltransferase [Prosthecochloris sp. SCSIO W1101]|uniref:DNA methyltransferase n=1 Tax=Prosthecochloris sp. SCSIO W1101 TaxID=2992242 RepID=UPI0039FD5AF3
MNLLPDRSVHLVITSPPYWQLKDYGTDTQIGFHESYESYINNLNLVWSECERVLYPGCRLCVNIGDQFARSVYYGRYKVIPIRTEIIKFCETIGFDYMGAIIWQKVTTTNTTGGASIMGSFPYPRNGILKLDYEFILIFKKQGDAPRPTKEQKERSAMTKEEWNTYFSGHWNFAGAKQDGHIAMFPEELPRRLIKMFAFQGDTILDPFMGSGTTNLAARNLGRNAVGYEINPEFIEITKQKLGVDRLDLVGTEYEFLKDRESCDLELAIEMLPYRFCDPHKLDKKVDPKKLSFGSRIDRDNRPQRNELFTVKKILSPEKVLLSNGLIVRLLGIKSDPVLQDKAIGYLNEKVKGKRIFLKYDSQKYDEQSNLLGYLYLQNKTFVNAHLIRSGFVRIETGCDYKYKHKFLTLSEQVNA